METKISSRTGLSKIKIENLRHILIRFLHTLSMSSLPNPKKTSNAKNIAMISGVLVAIGISLFVYLMWYVAPSEVLEQVKIISTTDSGCIGETMDGYPVNIGKCDAQPGDIVMAPVDQKVKERQDLMNPTGQ